MICLQVGKGNTFYFKPSEQRKNEVILNYYIVQEILVVFVQVREEPFQRSDGQAHSDFLRTVSSTSQVVIKKEWNVAKFSFLNFGLTYQSIANGFL